jgi:hypothetical protein
MLRAVAPAAPLLYAQCIRHSYFAVGHVVYLCRLVYQLVHGAEYEIYILQLYHRPRAGDGSAESRAYKCRL